MTKRESQEAALGQVLELTILLADDMTNGLAKDGLTRSRAHLLWEIGQRGPSTQRVLAEALGVSPRNITGLVDGLVVSGFVTREPHPTDRRATHVSFTDHGAAITQQMAAGAEELSDVLFGAIPGRKLTEFVDVMGGVLDRLRARLAEEE